MNAAADTSQIDEEIIRLKAELARTKNALTNHILKRRRVTDATADRNAGELNELRRSNFDDLGKVLRSLYVFESKLRREQQQIRRLLGERDTVIRQQQLEIAKLRQTVAHYCRRDADDGRDDANELTTSKPDLITCISRQSHCESAKTDDASPPAPEKLPANKSVGGGTARKNVPPSPADTWTAKRPNNNINFNNKNVYSKTVTDLSLNDISSFPNPTPNNNLFVVSNSIFSKNEFAHSEVSKETVTSVKLNGKVITSALKKADKYPSPKSVHFGKTTHIPEPDDDGQTDIVKTVETLLLQCAGDSTESENDTSSTASTDTSPSVSQMVRKFESICTVASADPVRSGYPAAGPDGDDGRYAAAAAAMNPEPWPKISEVVVVDDDDPDESDADPDSGSGIVSLDDLDPRNNFEEFRFEDSDLDRDYRSEADGLECSPGGRPVPSSVLRPPPPPPPPHGDVMEDCGVGGGGGGDGRVNYESFLEVTGLSQKSIITVQSCNRNVYGSHRNVQKPKDVKSRSRAKSTSFEYKTYPSSVKYWTEPYI